MVGKYDELLLRAAQTGNVAEVRRLIQLGANVNAQGGEYGRALQAAAAVGNEAVVNLLIESGADVNAESRRYGSVLRYGNTLQGGRYGNALQAAARNGNEAVVRQLIKLGANVNAQGGEFGNALQAAIMEGNETVVRVLIENGADVNAESSRYGNALQAAARNGNDAVVRLLIENGADINAKGGEYGNALQAAIMEGNETVVRVLIENGADINAKGGIYGNALQAAITKDNEAVVRQLIMLGANVNAQGGQYGNALQAAAAVGNEAVVRVLIENGADINAKSGIYGNALQAAIAEGNEAVVRQLIMLGANVNAQGGEYGNALQAAAAMGNEAVVRVLIENGADVNANDIYGNALQAAIAEGNEAVVRLLIENGADVNAQGGEYGNALQAAAAVGNEAVVRQLIKLGANVNAQGGEYDNALQAAITVGNEAVVRLLIENGADQGDYYTLATSTDWDQEIGYDFLRHGRTQFSENLASREAVEENPSRIPSPEPMGTETLFLAQKTPSGLKPGPAKSCLRVVPHGHRAVDLQNQLSPYLDTIFTGMGFSVYSFTLMLRQFAGQSEDIQSEDDQSQSEDDLSESEGDLSDSEDDMSYLDDQKELESEKSDLKIVLLVWIPPDSMNDENDSGIRKKQRQDSEAALLDDLRKLCDNFQVEVEIHHATRRNMAQDSSSCPTAHFFLSQIHPGAGIKGKKFFGTIGGLLVDRNKNNRKPYALTCGHVLESTTEVYSMDTESMDIICSSIEIAQQKWLSKLREAEDRMAEDTTELATLRGGKDFFDWQGEKIAETKGGPGIVRLDTLEVGKVTQIGEYKAAFERVVFIDGTYKRQDWGLVEATVIPPGSNKAQWPEWLGPRGVDVPLQETSGSGGSTVRKLGRSSGLTRGCLAAVPFISRDGKDVWSDTAVFSKHRRPFATPGDSGALVFDKKGGVIGMVYAGLCDAVGPNPVLLQSFGDLKRWINEKLDMDVVLDTTYDGIPWWSRDANGTLSPNMSAKEGVQEVENCHTDAQLSDENVLGCSPHGRRKRKSKAESQPPSLPQRFWSQKREPEPEPAVTRRSSPPCPSLAPESKPASVPAVSTQAGAVPPAIGLAAYDPSIPGRTPGSVFRAVEYTMRPASQLESGQ